MIEVDEASLPPLDVRSEVFARDPHGVLRATRLHGPLARSHRGIEVLAFDVCAAIFSSDAFETLGTDHFRDKGAPQSLLDFVEHGLLLNVDRARHDRMRRVLVRAFTIRRIEEQRDIMRDVAHRLLEPMLDTGGGDLVADFTERYPMEVLCRLLGVPAEDIPAFHRAAIDLHLMGAVPFAPGFARLDEALGELWCFVHGLLEARRVAPRGDFISALIGAQDGEARLTDQEIVWNLVNLLFAGQDTTRYQLASAVRVLTGTPGVWDHLAVDEASVPAALEEAMRLHPVSQFVVRRATAPAEAEGLRFPPGRRIILNLLAASRDPDAFPDPDRFDPGRGASYRLPFGWGLHHCLGHALARAEMIEALTLLARATTDVEVAAGTEAPAASMLGGPESLPLTFRRR